LPGCINSNTMKKFLFLPLILLFFSLQGCSWICRFYIANTSDKPVTIEMKLMDAPGTFPIFHYPARYYGTFSKFGLHKNNSVNFEGRTEMKADTLEKFSHYKLEIPPRSAIEIGQLQNDNYEKHDQHFINGRAFNFEKLSVSEKKVEITAATFDNYFKKGKYNEVYFVL
jgi:hypothetical protein